MVTNANQRIRIVTIFAAFTVFITAKNNADIFIIKYYCLIYQSIETIYKIISPNIAAVIVNVITLWYIICYDVEKVYKQIHRTILAIL